jgi:8-oxo-dGTP pyrophosphatase MutT (NUDIX family)
MNAFDWTVLASQDVIRDKWLTVRADTCRMPDGRIIAPCYVFEYRPWVNVVALTRDQQIVLVKQYRHGVQQTILELPGGTTDPRDTSPLEAIKRELLEETGYVSDHVVEVGQFYPNPASHNNRVHGFLALDVERVAAPHLDDTEQIETVLMPLDDLIEFAKQGGLAQSLHLSTLFFALARLGHLQ